MNYTDENRGKIFFEDRARQLNDFSGLRFDNITPTDIDGLMEYHDRGFTLLEGKYREAELPFGQRLALERLIKKLIGPAILIVYRHEVDDPLQSVDVSKCQATDVYFGQHGWLPLKKNKTTYEVINAFLWCIDNAVDPYEGLKEHGWI